MEKKIIKNLSFSQNSLNILFQDLLWETHTNSV